MLKKQFKCLINTNKLYMLLYICQYFNITSRDLFHVRCNNPDGTCSLTSLNDKYKLCYCNGMWPKNYVIIMAANDEAKCTISE